MRRLGGRLRSSGLPGQVGLDVVEPADLGLGGEDEVVEHEAFTYPKFPEILRGAANIIEIWNSIHDEEKDVH